MNPNSSPLLPHHKQRSSTTIRNQLHSLSTVALLASCLLLPAVIHAQGELYGQWDVIGHSGVSAMHGIVRPFTSSALFLERIQEEAHTPIHVKLKDGRDAYSSEFDSKNGDVRGLDVLSNMFCSAGGLLPDGTVASIAGGQPSDSYEQGYDGLRFFKPCNGTQCEWKQDFNIHLVEKRWYPTVESLANGALFILGGSNHAASANNEDINVPSFELYPPLPGNRAIDFPFLRETLPNNLYPIVHLLPDKNLFILASTKAIILSTSTWKILKRLPDIPGPPRNYPLTGGSILLPLTPENNYEAEILVCGGSEEFSSTSKADPTCGRIKPLSKSPEWKMENMPQGRMMPDISILADGTVVLINGASQGTAGFDRGRDPVLSPVHYKPNAPVGQRFSTWNPSVIARMYHSIAMILPDSSIMVAGSNPNGRPVEYGDGPYPTEYRVERFTPPYLLQKSVAQGLIKGWPTKIAYGQNFEIALDWYELPKEIVVALSQPGFITHSTHMSQRYVKLQIVSRSQGKVVVKAPKDGGLAPPSHYMIQVVLDGIPALESKWTKLTN